jgi:hypothetical protein
LFILLTQNGTRHSRALAGVVVKIADVLDTTVGYLLGETNDADAFQDPVMLKRLNDINQLPQKERDALLLTVDAFLRDFKTKKAYA